MEVIPQGSSLGAEIRDVDLGQLNDELVQQINQAFLDHQIIYFRNQTLSHQQYNDFAMRFGKLRDYMFADGIEGYPYITEIVKTETETESFGSFWHSDSAYLEQPPKITMLYARQVPERGGDTLFSNMYDAYDGLSEGMQRLVGRIKGWNTGDREKLRSRASAEVRANRVMSLMTEKKPGEVQTESAHPLVRTHKDTGRKALYIGGHTMAIDGWTDAESRPLIDFLREHSARPEYTCRFNWDVNSLAIWDNRCVQHYAVNDYPGQRRRMHRITIQGDEVPS